MAISLSTPTLIIPGIPLEFFHKILMQIPCGLFQKYFQRFHYEQLPALPGNINIFNANTENIPCKNWETCKDKIGKIIFEKKNKHNPTKIRDSCIFFYKILGIINKRFPKKKRLCEHHSRKFVWGIFIENSRTNHIFVKKKISKTSNGFSFFEILLEWIIETKFSGTRHNKTEVMTVEFY